MNKETTIARKEFHSNKNITSKDFIILKNVTIKFFDKPFGIISERGKTFFNGIGKGNLDKKSKDSIKKLKVNKPTKADLLIAVGEHYKQYFQSGYYSPMFNSHRAMPDNIFAVRLRTKKL